MVKPFFKDCENHRFFLFAYISLQNIFSCEQSWSTRLDIEARSCAWLTSGRGLATYNRRTSDVSVCRLVLYFPWKSLFSKVEFKSCVWGLEKGRPCNGPIKWVAGLAENFRINLPAVCLFCKAEIQWYWINASAFDRHERVGTGNPLMFWAFFLYIVRPPFWITLIFISRFGEEHCRTVTFLFFQLFSWSSIKIRKNVA